MPERDMVVSPWAPVTSLPLLANQRPEISLLLPDINTTYVESAREQRGATLDNQ